MMLLSINDDANCTLHPNKKDLNFLTRSVLFCVALNEKLFRSTYDNECYTTLKSTTNKYKKTIVK